jgi:NAD(P)-dependent dehydrogenase (short-subunit alcohol dehydrogenase family)
MNFLWQEQPGQTTEAGAAILARLLAQEPSLVRAEICVSYKATWTDLCGETEDALWICKQPAAAGESAFIGLRLPGLARLAQNDQASPDQLRTELLRRRLDPNSPPPPQEAPLHAVFAQPLVCRVQSEALLAVERSTGGAQRIAQILSAAGLDAKDGSDAAAYPGGLGLLVASPTAQGAYERIVQLVSAAETLLSQANAWQVEWEETPLPEKPVRKELAALRQALSARSGRSLLIRLETAAFARACARLPQAASLCARGPAYPAQTVLNGAALQAGFDLGKGAETEAAAAALLDPEWGLLVTAETAGGLNESAESALLTLRTLLRAEKLGADLPDNLSAPAPEASQPAAETAPEPAFKTDLFRGQVALVTGGASGIGKACVEGLLARGAAVVNLDVNPAVVGLFERPDYLGMRCDLTNEAEVVAAFETLARRFGGLDMVVLNAGIFPAGTRIEVHDLSGWQKVMRINLDSNLIILREAHPLLKLSPTGGRVVIVGSRNVPAPGAGASAYSASKAAVTQLGRVAALEWGKDQIRVNIIHPDAVFDTGIWTEDVLKKRAAAYGMTIQQYKTRNVLGVELNSRYVSEVIAEMLGPLFERITGAQLPVDGGNDRVI